MAALYTIVTIPRRHSCHPAIMPVSCLLWFQALLAGSTVESCKCCIWWPRGRSHIKFSHTYSVLIIIHRILRTWWSSSVFRTRSLMCIRTREVSIESCCDRFQERFLRRSCHSLLSSGSSLLDWNPIDRLNCLLGGMQLSKEEGWFVLDHLN